MIRPACRIVVALEADAGLVVLVSLVSPYMRRHFNETHARTVFGA